MPGELFLIPAPLGDTPLTGVIPSGNNEIISRLDWFIAEELRTARRFIKKADPSKDINKINFLVFNEHTSKDDLSPFLEPLLNGNDTGLLSEAGLPCVADPGNLIVEAAHRHGITVRPLSGPSSIMLALMASGMNGQNFAFQGYLPVDKNQRSRRLHELEQLILRTGQTQIFIEAPYRNLQVFEALTGNLPENMRLCIAYGLTTSSEKIIVKTIGEWRKIKPAFNKIPAVFLLNK